MKKLIIILAILLFTGTVYAVQIVRVAPLTYSIKSATTTVTTSATAIPATALAGRESIAIRLATTTDTVYIGGSDVTTSNGFALDSSIPSITMDLDDSVIVYGIVSAGTADVQSIEVK